MVYGDKWLPQKGNQETSNLALIASKDEVMSDTSSLSLSPASEAYEIRTDYIIFSV